MRKFDRDDSPKRESKKQYVNFWKIGNKTHYVGPTYNKKSVERLKAHYAATSKESWYEIYQPSLHDRMLGTAPNDYSDSSYDNRKSFNRR